MSLQQTIENIWDNRELLQNEDSQKAIREVISLVDKGELRTAEPTENGWQVNEWVKKAVVMYFPIQKMETIEVGPFEFHDKMPLKEIMLKKE
jgi:2,3,4,5-tetrahydropyridine-2-carboxylate N-succinyltransferase